MIATATIDSTATDALLWAVRVPFLIEEDVAECDAFDVTDDEGLRLPFMIAGCDDDDATIDADDAIVGLQGPFMIAGCANDNAVVTDEAIEGLRVPFAIAGCANDNAVVADADDAPCFFAGGLF